MTAGEQAEEDPAGLRRMLRDRREEILTVAAGHGATNVRVFGSVARQDHREGSDIDLIVDVEGANPLGRVSGLSEELSRLLRVRVDVVTDRLLRTPVSASATRAAVPL